MRVTEIFHSIQGESTHAGHPCVFIRLTGCPLRCTWCDTAYAFYGGREMSIEDIVAQTRTFGCDLVELTGGSRSVSLMRLYCWPDSAMRDSRCCWKPAGRSTRP